MTGYNRQEIFTSGDVIKADHGNNEFDQLAAAFAQATGHKHDGTTTEGAYVPLISDVDNTDKVEIIAGGARTTGNHDVTGDITVGGTVDGRDVAADGTKLDTIETSAKDDQVASEVPVTPAGTIASTDVQAALQELDTEKAALAGATFTGDVTVPNLITAGNVDGRDVSVDGTKLDGIEANAKDDQVASEVPFTPAGGIAATDVQAALQELDTEKADLSGDTFIGNVDFGAGIDVTGNITVTGTVDGRDVAADGTKLDGIEAGATADQSAAEIKTLYESNADTNAFTDADHTKLDLLTSTTAASGVVSKQEFFRQMEKNKDIYAGSGFAEWGKAQSNGGTLKAVNDGMWAFEGAVHNLFLGYDGTSNAVGVSRTKYPLLNVNGALLKLADVNRTFGSDNLLKFPEAPTANQLVTNGTFDTDTTGWTGTRGATLSVVSGALRVTSGGTTQNAATQLVTGLVVGQTYLTEVEVVAATGTPRVIVTTGSDLGIGTPVSDNYTPAVGDILRFEFTATDTSHYLHIGNSSASGSVDYDNVSVIDTADLSRQDLAFLEVWHENISDKDFVYPYGNVQFGATTFDGVSLVNNVVAAGYSTFGEWESSPTAGYGAVWSTLSDANKQKFLAEPYNNIYLDDTGELVQVRYRIRTVQGLGDDWEGTDTQSAVHTLLAYDTSNTDTFVSAQGSQTLPQDFHEGTGVAIWYGNQHTSGLGKVGLYHAGFGGAVVSSIAVDGLCFAVPIALVQRRNQGAYHPVYNPNGTANFNAYSAPADNARDWWNTRVAGNVPSTAECFRVGADGEDGGKTTGANAGAIAGGATFNGRPDGLYYDAIYAKDVKDLRNDANKVQDYNRLLEQEFNRLVAGEFRGFEGEKFGKVFTGTVNSVPSFNASFGTSMYLSSEFFGFSANQDHGWLGRFDSPIAVMHNFTKGTSFYIHSYGQDGTGEYVYASNVANDRTVDVTASISNGDSIAVMTFYADPTKAGADVTTPETGHSAETILHCDIIGDPANYPQEWKDHGMFGTPLLVDEDGNSLIPDGTSKTYKMSRKVGSYLLRVFTTDSGATWSSDTSFSPENTGNAFTASVAAGIIIMVFYTTKANPTELATNSEVLALGDVWAGQHNLIALGNNLVPSLIGKVGDSSGAGKSVLNGYAVEGFRISTHIGNEFTATADFAPTHNVVALDGSTSGPATKILPYLSRENGRGYVNLLYKEMKYDSGKDSSIEITAPAASQSYTGGQPYRFIGLTGDSSISFNDVPLVFLQTGTFTVDADWFNDIYIGEDGFLKSSLTGANSSPTMRVWDGNGWGDNNQFTVLNNESTETDDNGNAIIVGQKRVELLNFINDEE